MDCVYHTIIMFLGFNYGHDWLLLHSSYFGNNTYLCDRKIFLVWDLEKEGRKSFGKENFKKVLFL